MTTFDGRIERSRDTDRVRFPPPVRTRLGDGRAADSRSRLQQRLGNQAIQRLVRSRGTGSDTDPVSAGTESRTALPEPLRHGLEALSGVDLSDVRVHYNSPEPAKIGALAYTQGRHIHVAPGQETHLPHEGWHAVQQQEGRVASTTQTRGVGVNDDRALEREADRMGERAVRTPDTAESTSAPRPQPSAVVQREAASDTPTWTLPSWYASESYEVTTQGEAVYHLIMMTSHLSDVRSALDPDTDAELVATLDAWPLFLHLKDEVIDDFNTHNERPLEEEHLFWLTAYNEQFGKPYTEAERTLRNRADAPLESIREAVDASSFDEAETQLNEKLHELFIRGASKSAVAKVGLAISKIEQYRASVHQVLDYAERVGQLIRTENITEVISIMQGRSRDLGTLLTKVQTVADVASSLDTLFRGSGAHGAHGQIDRFRAGVGLVGVAIDSGVGLSRAMPILGQLWSNYYLPMTLRILDQLDEIATLVDTRGRLEAAFLIDQQARSGGGAPRIPNGYEEYFPGGQPVLDFMWTVVHGGTPNVTTGVERYFAERAEQFSAAAQHPWGQDEMKTYSSTLWPFDDDDKVKKFVTWVKRNKETVWAQLYGNQRWE